jgi:DNA-binding winged helix-turn-helix (wHTH) protein
LPLLFKKAIIAGKLILWFMGKIEEVIYENYKKAITEGDYDQARRAVELGKILKEKTEVESFIDYDSLKIPITKVLGKHFNPFPYKYNQLQGTVELASGVITLTETENKLFCLLSQNETKGNDIKIITKSKIAFHIWGGQNVSSNLIRINVLRLRRKIEPDAENPQVLLSLASRGYIFLGNKTQTF